MRPQTSIVGGQTSLGFGQTSISTLTKGGVSAPYDILAALGNAASGGDLYDYFDAEVASTITLETGKVSSWTTVLNNYAHTQGTTLARPSFEAAGLAGLPAVVGDGTDDTLVYTPNPWPTGSTPSEIWMLMQDRRGATDTTEQAMYGQGGGAAEGPDCRSLGTKGSGSARRFTAYGPVTGSGTVVDAATVHVVRHVVGATGMQVYVDDVLRISAAATPNTLTSRSRIFANHVFGSGSRFALAAMSFLAVTKPLSSEKAAGLSAYLKQRGNIT